MFFAKKLEKPSQDYVWATTAAKLVGIQRAIESNSTHGVVTLLIAHFNETLTALRRHLDQRGASYQLIEHGLDLPGLSGVKTAVMLSEILPGRPMGANTSAEPRKTGARFHMVVAEHYPIPARDEAIHAFAKSAPDVDAVEFHSALDEPLMTAFGSSSTVALLEQIGMKEDEPINHVMVGKAIVAAQQRVRKSAPTDHRTETAREWFQYNCPSGVPQ